VVNAIYTGSEFVEVSSSEHDVGIVLESTSFYAEQGGQVLLPPCFIHCAGNME
jgi:alanyl-tRNA synthetase